MEENPRRRECVDLSPPGYKLRSFPRATRGGGLAAIYSDHFPPSANTTFPFTHSSFELVELTLTAPEHIHVFLPLQTPTLQKKQSSPILSFSVSSLIFRYVVTLRGKLIILGDFNIHFDSPANSLTSKTL